MLFWVFLPEKKGQNENLILLLINRQQEKEFSFARDNKVIFG